MRPHLNEIGRTFRLLEHLEPVKKGRTLSRLLKWPPDRITEVRRETGFMRQTWRWKENTLQQHSGVQLPKVLM